MAESETYDESRLILFLEEMHPSEFARVVTRIPGAEKQIGKNSSHYESVGQFISYVRGSTGPGFDQIIRALEEIYRKDIPDIGRRFVRSPQSGDVLNQYKQVRVILDANALSDEEVLQVLKFLRRYGGAEIVLTRIEKGSTILFIEGTIAGIEQLTRHLNFLPVGFRLILKQSNGPSRHVAFVPEGASENNAVSPQEHSAASTGSEPQSARRLPQPRESHNQPNSADELFIGEHRLLQRIFTALKKSDKDLLRDVDTYVWKCGQIITRFIVKLVGNTDDAEDIVQEYRVLLFVILQKNEAVERLLDWGNRARHAWHFTVARHKALDLLRKRRRSGRIDRQQIQDPPRPTPPVRLPDAAAIREEVADPVLAEKLPRLSDDELLCLWRNKVEGVEARDIARELRGSQDKSAVMWVYNRIRNAKKKLGS